MNGSIADTGDGCKHPCPIDLLLGLFTVSGTLHNELWEVDFSSSDIALDRWHHYKRRNHRPCFILDIYLHRGTRGQYERAPVDRGGVPNTEGRLEGCGAARWYLALFSCSLIRSVWPDRGRTGAGLWDEQRVKGKPCNYKSVYCTQGGRHHRDQTGKMNGQK